MKFKKSWIFWVCYYGVAITANVLAAVLLRDKWNFNGWSVFPIAYILILVFLVWYFPSIWNHRRSEDQSALYQRWRFKDFDELSFRMRAMSAERNGSWQDPQWIFMKKIALACIPLYPPFIFFFGNTAKLLSFLIATAIHWGSFGIWMFFLESDGKAAKKRREDQARELKEQKEREELGKWK